MSNFTPGPWKFDKKSQTVQTREGFYVVSGSNCADPLFFHFEGRENADARLIAAAPDLYAAISQYVAHFGDPLKVARAALAKADGKAEGA